jgi:hypothetical protein
MLIEDTCMGFDSFPTNIRGEAKKLKELGWTPNILIKEILNLLVN